jgi:hypothetical protein
MRIETTETKVYKFSELSEEAKNTVRYETINCSVWEFWGGDIEKTLEEFQTITACKVSLVSSSQCEYYIIDSYPTHWYDGNDFFNDLQGARTLSWLEHNVIKYVRKPKYLSMCNGIKNCVGVNSISRNSKCQTDLDGCNLTGHCYDNSILWPIISKEGRREIVEQNLTPYEVIEKCLQSFHDDIKSEDDAMKKDDYLIDHCEANNYEFTEEGKLF